jgi:hypothetical protein
MGIQFKLKAMAAGMLAVLALTQSATPAAAQSAYYCDGQARDYAARHANGAGFVGGTIGGAVTGAIIGGIIDGRKGAGRGAAIGGGLGAFGGAVHESQAWQRAYDEAYSRCMAASHGAPAAYERPEPWSDEWYDYCSAKYRSFNPDTGRYRTYSGKYRLCR